MTLLKAVRPACSLGLRVSALMRMKTVPEMQSEPKIVARTMQQ